MTKKATIVAVLPEDSDPERRVSWMSADLELWNSTLRRLRDACDEFSHCLEVLVSQLEGDEEADDD